MIPPLPIDLAPRPVGLADLEAGLARAAGCATDPTAGLFGPSSHVWAVQQEALVFLGAARAMLLQTAHPWVAQGVARQSRALDDPIGRFHRTFTMVFSMVYGSLDQARQRARQLHRIHAAIRGAMEEDLGLFRAGSPYAANDVHALLWVHATLWDTSVRIHEAVHGPMDPAFREAYYAETRRFAWLFGIPDEALPKDWAAFQDYVTSVFESDLLAVGTAGRRICDSLVKGQGRWFLPRLPWWYLCLTAEMLPPHLREGYGLPYGEREAARADLAWRRIRFWYPRVPGPLRKVPAYREALGRISGRKGPDLLTRVLNLIWLGRSSLVP